MAQRHIQLEDTCNDTLNDDIPNQLNMKLEETNGAWYENLERDVDNKEDTPNQENNDDTN